MAKIRILHVTEHPDLWNMAGKFPIEVEAEKIFSTESGEFDGYQVKGSEFIRHGADEWNVCPEDDYFFPAWCGPDCSPFFEPLEE